jgi:hypothetical protein
MKEIEYNAPNQQGAFESIAWSQVGLAPQSVEFDWN